MSVTIYSGNRILVNTDSSDGNEPDGFYNPLTGEPVDPTVVMLKVSVNDAEPTVYTYASGDGVIVRTGAGAYYASLDTTNQAGTWTVEWVGDPDGTSPQLCQAVNATTVVISSAPL